MRDLGEWDAHLGKAHLANPEKCPFPHTRALIQYLGQSKETALLLTPDKRSQFLQLVNLPYELGVMLHADPRLRGAVMDEIMQQVGYQYLPDIMNTIAQQMVSMEEPLAGKTKVLEFLFSQGGVLKPKKQVLEVDTSVKVDIRIAPPNLPLRSDEEVIEGVYEKIPQDALPATPVELPDGPTKRFAPEETALKSILRSE
jgi:hypothetical protein